MSQKIPLKIAVSPQKILLGAVLVGFGCIGISLISGFALGDSAHHFTGKKDRERLGNQKPLAQIFEAKENGLSEVKYHLGNLHLWPGEELRFELRDAECQNVLAQASAKPLLFVSPIYTQFGFDRIPDSQGQTYCAVILYETPYTRKSADQPFLHTSEMLGTSYTLLDKNKTKENQTLQFRPSYSAGSLTQNLWHLTERMSQYKPGYIKGSPLLILMTLVFISSLLLSLWIVFVKEEGRSE